MITATAQILGTSPYSQSKVITTPKEADETHEAHEIRTWRERMHTTPDGHVYIPPSAFKNCLSEAGKWLGKKIRGAGNKTYTARFEAGLFCTHEAVLSILGKDVEPELLFVPSDGKRGGGTRVWKYFPVIPPGWEATATFQIVDALITQEIFDEHLRAAGDFIGIGRFRPSKNGYYGRFEVKKLTWSER